MFHRNSGKKRASDVRAPGMRGRGKVSMSEVRGVIFGLAQPR